MNLSKNWLSDYVDVSDIDVKAYCDRMTDTGSKVEGYEILAEDIENVVVARITEIKPHENSDHLQICQVDIGEKTVQIVTGAQNVFEGAIVPAAIPVAKLPGDVVIKSGKLRGVQSDGMLCSMGELNLTEHDMPGKEPNGILILDEEYSDKIGMDIRDALMLRDTVVEFEITSNRPDCLSVTGLARETAVSFGREYKERTPSVKCVNDGDKIGNYLSVKIDAPDLCHRYMARVVKNVKIEPSPLWLRMRLRASGVRPINNIVDITNYVMLEYGQPMHAFDYKCLDGSHIIVREAGEGECFKSLDDIDHTLKAGMLVISDEKKAVALAGVMGGANSEITDETKTVVFESANFDGPCVRVTSRALGMRTESSARFEKGIDEEATIPAIERACELVELLGAGDVVDGIIDVYPNKKAVREIKLDSDRINSFLGTNISKEEMIRILTSLTFKVENDTVYVPSYRDDVEGMQDVAEEIARIYGYNEIETTNVVASLTQGERTPHQAYDVKVKDTLCAMGLYEINTFSFISPKYYDKICMPKDDKRRSSVVISNPLGEDTSVMRTTSMPSMLEVLSKNHNLKNEEAMLYEVATIYLPNEDKTKLPEEPKEIAIGMYGSVDFYDLKGVIEGLLDNCGIKGYYVRAEENDPSFHPGRCAKVYANNDTCLGIFGEIHPLVSANYSFTKRVYVGVLDFEAMFDNHIAESKYTPLPKFPALTRDFSFVCDESLEVGTIEGVMKKAGVKLLESVKLFDIYRGAQVGENKKSVSFSVSLRASDRTLNDEEADGAVKKILKALEKELGITLRA